MTQAHVRHLPSEEADASSSLTSVAASYDESAEVVRRRTGCFRVASLVVARHLGTDPTVVLPRHSLRDDLGLDRLDLAFIALRIGEQLEIDVPFSQLNSVSTVADLGALVARIVASNSRIRRLTRIVPESGR